MWTRSIPRSACRRKAGSRCRSSAPSSCAPSAPSSSARPFEFRRYGQCGAPVSSLFPHIADCVDDLAIIHSMVAEHSEHTAGNYFMHSGSGLQGRPSMGAWVTYGLGSACRNLPGFVVMDTGMIPPGGTDIFGSGFLPASYQGSLFRRGRFPVADHRAARKRRRFAEGQTGSARATRPAAWRSATDR